MIEARNLCVSFARKPILQEVDFDARAGELTAIIGPNGSGKTTLMRTLSGDIRINGTRLSGLPGWRLASMRAVLPQSATLSFPFTVREVVSIGTTVMRKEHRQKKALLRRIDEALERVDLGGFAGRYYQELSGGEQQRVQLARVLCQVWEPLAHGIARWLFLDEPVSSLDIRHQLAILELAQDYARRGGGVVAVMHDLNLTAMFADRIHVVSKGRSAASGEPRSVLTDDILSRVFGCTLRVGALPPEGTAFVLPQASSR